MVNNIFNKINNISKKGYINNLSSLKNGAGYTFEKIMGIKNNSSDFSDICGFELKTKLDNTYNRYISLFSCTPISKYENSINDLRIKYGYNDKNDLKLFICQISTNKSYINSHYICYIKINYKLERIELIIENYDGIIINNEFFWPFELLKTKLYIKLNKLILIHVKKKVQNNIEYYWFYKYEVYKNINFKTFIKYIEKNLITITFNLEYHKNENNYGELYDHGTSFKVNIKEIGDLYK